MGKGLLIILACLALLVAGCGSDSASTSSSSAESSPAPKGEESSTVAKEESPAESKAAAKKGEEKAKKKTKPKVSVPGGPPPEELAIKDLEEGSGPEAKPGDEVTVQYVGVNYRTGKQFDASWDRGEPFTFKLGEGLVVEGWEKGIPGMKPGGRRELIIPPELGYGYRRTEGVPPGSTLIFVVDLVSVK
jgi:FKBP-type peptidyl-prolyl cis-trans isomerase